MAARVKLVVSHRHNLRTQVKMAQVDGCTFFRREGGWKHVDKSCKRIFHWLWTLTFQIGECLLVVKNGKLAHKDDRLCVAAADYIKSRDEANAAAEEIEKAKTQVATEQAGKDEWEQHKKMELVVALKRFGAMEAPSCLVEIEHPIPITGTEVGGCGFYLEGDVFKHKCDADNGSSRCKLREHYEDRDGAKIRLTRKPGWDLEAFVKEAQAAIAQAVTQAPANPREHIFVEV